MRITSPDFSDGQPLPLESAFENDNRRPTLIIDDLPDNTINLAVIVHDPDAPNGDFTHWLAWNFPAHITNIPGDNVPTGVTQGKNDMGRIGWIGPAPPSGTHHYHFVVYALNKSLDLPPETTKEKLIATMQGKILGQAELVGTFSASET